MLFCSYHIIILSHIPVVCHVVIVCCVHLNVLWCEGLEGIQNRAVTSAATHCPIQLLLHILLAPFFLALGQPGQ